MKKVTSFLIVAAIALGFAACNSEDVPNPASGKGNTYAGLTVSILKSGTRLSQSDNAGTAAESAITAIDLLSSAGDKAWTPANPIGTPTPGTAEAATSTFWTADNTTYQVGAWKTTGGSQTMAVVLNKGTITGMNAGTASTFVYGAGTADATANNNTINAITGSKAAFVMTSASAAKTIQENISFVTASAATTDAENGFAFLVERVAAQGIVKMAAGVATSNVDVMQGETKVGTVTQLRFSAANGATKTYLFRNKAGNRTMETSEPYAYSNYTSAIHTVSATAASAANATELYRLGNDPQTIFGGTSPYAAIAVNASTTAVGTDAIGIYFLENSVALPAVYDVDYWNFNRSAYAKVYAMYTPVKIYDLVGGVLVYVDWADRSTSSSTTFYKGETDGLLYTTLAAAQASATAPNQKAYMYKDGKTVYRVLWNRQTDTTGKKTLNGNTRRNNIYLIKIEGFSGLGANYDPNDPNDPNIPKPTENTEEPTTPPVNPPVDKADTYMRITAEVLQWNVVERGVTLE